MNRPVRTTLVFAIISALIVMPLAWALAGFTGWTLAIRLALWADLLVYALLLVRWGRRGPGAIFFPMALLLGAAFWPGVGIAFIFLGLGILSWIRSGICFRERPIRAFAAETITVGGGAGLVALLAPATLLTWAVSMWLFGLVQALYFFILPVAEPLPGQQHAKDGFEQAHREAQRVLEAIGSCGPM